MAFDKTKALQKFETFMSSMDEQLAWLLSMAESHGYVFTYSISDFEDMEELFDEMRENIDENMIDKLIVIFSRYLGETVLRNYGGKWMLSLEDEKDAYFNTPIIIGHSPVKDLPFSPMFTVRAYYLRKKKGTVRRAVDSHVNPSPLDLSHLPVEEG